MTRRIYTDEEKRTAKLLADHKCDEQFMSDYVQQEAAKIRATWTREREYAARGRPDSTVEITEIAVADFLGSMR